MITNAFLYLVYAFVYGISMIVSAFGTVSASNDVTTAIVTIRSYYMSLNAYLPIDVILAIVAFDLAFEGFVFAYKMIRWSYQKVPMIN